MAWRWTPYTVPLIVPAAILFSSGLYVLWRRRHVSASRTGALLLLASAEWLLAYVLGLGSANLRTALFWTKVQYVGVVMVPTAWFVYTLQYTDRDKWLTRRTLALLSIVPLSTLLLTFTNEAHGLIWSHVALTTEGTFVRLDKTWGVGFWAFLAYSYTLVLIAAFLLIQMLTRSHRLYRLQASILLFAILLPALGGVLHVFGLNPFPWLDLTTLALAVTGPIVAWGIYRLRLGDIVAVTREAIIENMDDGVIVLDAQDRIVDLNPAAQRLFGHIHLEAIGQPMEQLWAEWPSKRERFRDETEVGQKMVISKGGEQHTYDVHISPLIDWRGRLTCQVVVLRDINEHKRAEKALRESEERYRLLFENITDVVYSIDPEFQVLSVSPSVERLLGYRPEELIGRSFQELNILASDYLEIALSDMMRVLVGEQITSSVYEFIAKDGTRKFGEVSGAPLVREGQVVAVISVARDITERKRTEEALKVSQEYIRNIVDSSLDMIIAVDMDRHIVEFNKAAQETFGYRPEEVLGKHVDMLYADPQEGLTVHQTTVRRGRCVREILDRRKNGEVFPCFLSASVLRDERGQLVGVMGVSRDITERKQAEEALRNAHDKLERRVEELTFLNRVGRVVTSSLDLEQVLTTVMEETALVLRTEAGSISLLEEESGDLVFEAAVGPESEKVKGLRVPLGRGIVGWVAREGQRLLVPDVKEDPRFYSSIDEITGFITQSVLAVPMKVKGKVIGVIEAVNKVEGNFGQADVALLASMAQSAAIAIENARLFRGLQDRMEELRRTQAQLLQVQKMESIGQLAAGIAHDFNNLLTPISGFTELLLQKAPEGSQQQEYLRYIKVAAEHAAALTRQLRLFTRQKEGDHRPVQLNSLVEETRDLLEHSMPKGIAIELRLGSNLWAVEADPSQISQVLINLCVNARDAMPDGGTLTLQTRNVILDEEYARAILEARPEPYVCLSVSDTGCGMSPEVQARLFEPFFTTKEIGKGTGLGLAVVYGIVKGHGGFIQVYSEEGQGSTFRVYLPAVEWAVKEREAEGLELAAGTETILLVDDEETVQILGQRVLEGCGYTVLIAENGVQALEMYQAHRGEIALVVLDVVMPEMGGQECLRRLRELDPQVKVLVSTGYTANSTAQKLVAEGALGVVEKPFLLQDFAAAVRAALDKL